MHFKASDDGPGVGLSYLAHFEMRMRADIIFFYVIIPAIMLIETSASNYCLWTDKLRPTYVAVSSILAPALWVTQLILWSMCLFAGSSEAVGRYGSCPNIFKTAKYRVYPVQSVGSDDMAVWGMPSLLVLYTISLIFALIACKREQQQRRLHESFCGERKWYASVSQRSSDTESQQSQRSMKEAVSLPSERLQVGQVCRPLPNEDPSMARLEPDS